MGSAGILTLPEHSPRRGEVCSGPILSGSASAELASSKPAGSGRLCCCHRTFHRDGAQGSRRSARSGRVECTTSWECSLTPIGVASPNTPREATVPALCRDSGLHPTSILVARERRWCHRPSRSPPQAVLDGWWIAHRSSPRRLPLRAACLDRRGCRGGHSPGAARTCSHVDPPRVSHRAEWRPGQVTHGVAAVSRPKAVHKGSRARCDVPPAASSTPG